MRGPKGKPGLKVEVPSASVKRIAAKSSLAPALFGNPPRILKPSRGHSPENAAANMGQIGNASRLHVGHRSRVYKLNQKPYDDQERGRDEGDPHENEDY